MKTTLNQGEKPNLYFWRDSKGNEVNVIVDGGLRLRPIEIKAGQTLNSVFFTGLQRWCDLAGEQAGRPSLVYGGSETLSHRGVEVFGWGDVGTIGES